MIGCIVCLGFAAGDKKNDKIGGTDVKKGKLTGQEAIVAGFLAILCGVVAAVLMSTRQFCIRKYKGAYTPFANGLDAAILKNMVLMISSIILTFKGDQYPLTKDFEWTWRTLLIGALSGTLMDAGSLLVGIAAAIGIAAAA